MIYIVIVYKIDNIGTFFPRLYIFYRNSVLQVIHEDLVALQKAARIKVAQFSYRFHDSGIRQIFIDFYKTILQGRFLYRT